MERDAAAAPTPPADPTALAEVVPPYEWSFVWKVGLAGLVLIAVAAALGVAASALDGNLTPTPQWPGHGARLLLVLVGSITVGAAVSMRPDRWQVWALGAAAAALAIAGTPAHWDSFRLLFFVLAGVAALGAVFLAAPAKYRLPALSAIVLFHFGGIFLATTTPPATPWVTEQVFMRVYNPYLQFLYLRNAYHFYSPQPGPASVLVFLLKTETGTDPVTGQKQYTTQWVVLPRRPADVKDPLGLTYYRYLAVTEQVARGQTGAQAAVFERNEMLQRRALVPIPLHPTDPHEVQYQLLTPDVARYIVPSYASHVIMEHSPSTEVAKKTTVKVYRLQHNTMAVEDFVNARKRPNANTSPYHPTTYRPFFLGEFDALGNLLDPQEPMLYWLLPIIPRPGGAGADANKRDFLDYMSFHALGPDILGPNTTVVDLDEKPFKDRAFDWNQLR